MSRGILTPNEMRAAEQAVFDTGVDSYAVMRRAGLAVAEFVHKNWPTGRIQVLCGPGGNGGDGIVAASELSRRWRSVDVFCAAEPDQLTGDTAKAAKNWDGPIGSLDDAIRTECDIVIDGLFGAGLSRPLTGAAASLAERGGQIVSIDVPSGIDGLAASPLGPCFKAHATITFAALRPAHVLMPSAPYCGHVVVADIGVPFSTNLFENSHLLWRMQLPVARPDQHKHDRGHLKVFSGGITQTGAARLAARAGLRAGAGLVTVLSPADAVASHAAHLTAEMLRQVVSLEEVVAECCQASAIVIGPALGIGDQARAKLDSALSGTAPAVIDADAITMLSESAPKGLKSIRQHDLLTPHIGEFKRLFGDLLATSGNKVDAVRNAAQQAGCAVLLKGPDTVIAAPDGKAIVNTHATPWLATAGSGDVLAGIAGGFMAQGVDTFMAAAMAAWMHGEAGLRAGPGLIATDLEKQLPAIFASIHGPQP